MGTATVTVMVLMRMAMVVVVVVVTVIVMMIMIAMVICDFSYGDGHDHGHHGDDEDGDRNDGGDSGDYCHGLGHDRGGNDRPVVVILRMVMVNHSGGRSTTCFQEIGAPASHGVPASLKIAAICSIHGDMRTS